jgi:hypothetical protein
MELILPVGARALDATLVLRPPQAASTATPYAATRSSRVAGVEPSDRQ